MTNNFGYTIEQLLTPVLNALKILGGSGSINEIEEGVVSLLDISEEQVNLVYKDNVTALSYKLAIARIYLKEAEYLYTSEKGVWILTNKGLNTNSIHIEDIESQIDLSSIKDIDSIVQPELNELYKSSKEIIRLTWQDQLLGVLKKISPQSFERLIQRLLRELGFINVVVTGKVGDGGIDGKGVVKINGIISFNIAFQCKRYQGSVSASEIRDFQGALQGRADKGLFITTGKFTRDAIKEARRDGAVQIDLIDGIELSTKLKDVGLGVYKETIEKITINTDWFNSI